MKSIWGPKSVQNEVGNRVGKAIGKRRAKEGFIGANMGSKMGSCWVENRRRLGSKSNMEKRSEKKGWHGLWDESSVGRRADVSLWLKPKAAPKNGGTEDWRIKGLLLLICHAIGQRPDEFPVMPLTSLLEFYQVRNIPRSIPSRG